LNTISLRFSTVFKGTVSRDGFGFWTYRLLLPLAGGFYANAGGKRPIQRQLLLVQYKQQANPLLSMLNYTPLVISSNDKNKQQTLSSQRKLALIARNTLFCYKIIGAPKKLKTWLRLLFRPKSNYTCHLKPNLSRELL
jgi:hypothetical protein